MGDRGHETGGTIGWGLRGLGVAGITLSLVPVAHFPQPLRIIVFFAGLGDKWGGVMGVRGHETRGTIGWVLRGLRVAGITLLLVHVAHFSQPLRIIAFRPSQLSQMSQMSLLSCTNQSSQMSKMGQMSLLRSPSQSSQMSQMSQMSLLSCPNQSSQMSKMSLLSRPSQPRVK